MTGAPVSSDVPMAVDDRMVICQGKMASKDVIANDVPEEGSPLGVDRIVTGENRYNGACYAMSDGRTVSYFPRQDFSGEDTCDYIACDALGRCKTATIRIRVNKAGSFGCAEITDSPTEAPTTDAPTHWPSSRPTSSPISIDANDDSEITLVNTPVIMKVLGNDAGAGGPLSVVKIEDAAANGTCDVIHGGSAVTYTPNYNFVGEDACAYQTCDDEQRCDTATITLKVVETYCPDVRDDVASTSINTPVLVTCLGNDVAPVSPLVITEVFPASHGSCNIIWDSQAITYTPMRDFEGGDSCEYVACAQSNCGQAKIFFDVSPASASGCQDAEKEQETVSMSLDLSMSFDFHDFSYFEDNQF